MARCNASVAFPSSLSITKDSRPFSVSTGMAPCPVSCQQSVEQSEVGLSLEDLIRRGARDLIQKAVEVEVQQFYVRRSARVSAALPWLYMKGISTVDLPLPRARTRT